MKVSELIKILETMPPDATVVLVNDATETANDIKNVEVVNFGPYFNDNGDGIIPTVVTISPD